MHVAKLINLMAVRHKSGGPGKTGTLVVKDGKAIPTWLAPVACYFFKAEKAMAPEQILWREVAARAVLDALGFTPPLRNNKSPYERGATITEAQRWFRHDGEYMRSIFEMAGIPHEPVRAAVLRLIEERKIK
jgi:hypothetical protein